MANRIRAFEANEHNPREAALGKKRLRYTLHKAVEASGVPQRLLWQRESKRERA